MSRPSTLVSAFVLLASLATAAGAVELDLETVVSLALETNPALKAVEERRHEVEAGITEARAEAFPELSFTSSWSRSRSPALLNSPDFDEFIENFPGGAFEPREQELNRMSLEFNQPLYTFGKIGAAIDLAREVAAVADAQIDAARLDTALAAAEAYYGVLAARRSLETVEEQEKARRESLGVIQARYDIGEATRLELLRSQASLSELLPDLAAAEGRLVRARTRLRTVLDLERSEPLEVRAVSERQLAAPGDLDGLLEVAAARRPELAELERRQEALVSQQRVTRADGLPQIELSGAYGREARIVQDLGDALFDNWSVAVGLSWEFFDGGSRRGEIAGLESQRRQLEWERRDLLNQVRLEVEQALTEYETARARLRAARVAARAAREARRVASESYREGVALQADWLDAEQRATEAEIVLVEAYYDGRIRAARLARALGYLPTEDVLQGGATRVAREGVR